MTRIKKRELSLFTGAGGGVLASKILGWETVGYVEWDEYCQKVIKQRIRDGWFDNAPIFGDIQAFIDQGYARAYSGMVDIVSAGFPCQPFSSACRGNRVAENLWPLALDVITRVEPNEVFAENVSRAAIEAAGEDLWSIGYAVRIAKVSATDVGSDHIRRRFWLRAYSDVHGELPLPFNAETSELSRFCEGIWKDGPGESGVAHGVACRVDRLRAIGNGQVPVCAAMAYLLLRRG